MALSSSTLRPGFLVSLKTSVRGNVTYVKHDLATEQQPTDGVSVVRWETERTVTDPAEHEAAKKARAKAQGLIKSVCSQSAFGLLCPEVDSERLEAAVVEARKVVDAFNDTAKLSRVGIYILTGRVMPDDVEAVRAINSEIRELMAEMANGIEGKDVEAIRDAANRVKGIGEMLSADAQAKVQIAVETARTTARKMVKEGDATAVDASAVKRIREMRTSFLDLDDAADVASPTVAGSTLDLLPSGADAPQARVRADLEG